MAMDKIVNRISEQEKELNYMKECINITKTYIVQAEANEKTYRERKEELEQEIRKEGVEPDELNDAIINNFNEIERCIKEANELIPFDLLKKLNKLPQY